jgi:hypothetical protein
MSILHGLWERAARIGIGGGNVCFIHMGMLSNQCVVCQLQVVEQLVLLTQSINQKQGIAIMS